MTFLCSNGRLLRAFATLALASVWSLMGASSFAIELKDMVVPWSVHNEVQKDTVYGVRGTDNNPVAFCADATPCKLITSSSGKVNQVCLAGASGGPGAFYLPNSCWDLRTEFTCLQYATDCSVHEGNPRCKEVGSPMCVLPAPPNMPQGAFARVKGCLSTTRHFICLDSDAVITPPAPTGCEMTSTVDGLDWSSKSESASSDFIAVATSAEIARQLAAYGDKDGSEINNLFKGVALGCRNKGFGLKDCCTEKSAGVRSNAVMAAGMGAATNAIKYGAGYAAVYGSYYVYDTIGPAVSGTFLQSGVNAMWGSATSSGLEAMISASNFGIMGFGTTAAGAASGAGSTLGLYSASSSMQVGTVLGNPVFFNPYAFALAVGFQLVMATLECNELERELASARSEQLCQYVGNYCSSPIRVLGIYIGCTETTSNFCCFNGQLGKAIATGAREQLGMSWGTGETPSCGGFTMAQLSSVDFTKPAMQTALKPFQDQIMRNYQTKVAPGMASGQTELETRKAGDAAAKRLCQQRKALDPTTVCPG